MRSRTFLSLSIVLIWVMVIVAFFPGNVPAVTAEADSFVSDDFNPCGLKPDLWSKSIPAGADILTNGTHVSFVVPAGTGGSYHSISEVGTGLPVDNNTVNIMQPAVDEDYTIEVKWDSVPSQRYQLQGIIVKDAESINLLRLEFYPSSSTSIQLFAGFFNNGQLESKLNVQAYSGTLPDNLYMRVARVGDQWTLSHSDDGTNWTDEAAFTASINVAQVGLYGGNEPVVEEGTGNILIEAPAFTATADYFFNADDPISPINSTDLTIGTSLTGNGSITLDPDQATYACETEVTIEAVADMGWVFNGWGGDFSGTTNPQVISIVEPLDISATFILGEYSVSANASPVDGGTVTIDPDTGPYNINDVVEFTAVPNTGWLFDSWSGDASGTANPTNVTVMGDTVVTANFIQEEYTLTLNAIPTAGGTITADPDQTTYHYNDVVTLTAVPNPNYAFSDWSGAVTDIAISIDYVVTGDATINANFFADYKIYLPFILK